MSEVKTNKPNAHIETMRAALGTPTLEGLSYALRHPETWPKGYHWNYADTCHCALGLVHELWDEKIPAEARYAVEPYLSNACRLLALGRGQGQKLFVGTSGYDDIDPSNVTPEMIADSIDAYLARE